VRLYVDQTVLLTLAGVFALLLVASVVVWRVKRARPGGGVAEVERRVKSWWILAAVFAVALVLSRRIALTFFCVISFLAFKEYLSLIPTRRADRRVLFWAYMAIPIQYLWIGYKWYGMFIIWIPVYAFLFLPLRMVLIGETKGFLQAAGTIHWGLMSTVFAVSHVAFLLVLPEHGHAPGGGPALVLYLVLLTEFNDVAQYLSGKTLGQHHAVPTVSPNKTLEGLLGGLVATLVLAWLLAPLLTPLSRWEAPAAGLIIGLSGFVGDVVMSALKRDLAVKDSGSLIPGHGGILDRLDSLTYTAPLFFHFIRYTHF